MAKTERNVSIPTIHMNGTSAESLLKDLMTAYHATAQLQSAMRDVTPNARDYYTQGDEAATKARNDHATRQKMISDIRTDLETIIIGIQDQQH